MKSGRITVWTILVVLLWATGVMANKVPIGVASWQDSETGVVSHAMGPRGTPTLNYLEDGEWKGIDDDWKQIGQRQVWKSEGPHKVYADSTGKAIYARGNHYLGTHTLYLVKFKISDSSIDDVLAAALPDSVTTWGPHIKFWNIFPGVNKVLENRPAVFRVYRERFEFTQEARDRARDNWGPWQGYRLAVATRLNVDSLNLSWRDIAGVFDIEAKGRLTDGWVAATDADTNVFVLARSFLEGPEGVTDIPVRKFIVKRQGVIYLVEMFNPLLTVDIPEGTIQHNASFGDDNEGMSSSGSLNDNISGLFGSPSSNGTVDSMRMFIQVIGRGPAHPARCAIYDDTGADPALVDTTEEKSFTVGEFPAGPLWKKYDFIGGASISSAVTYIIVGWALAPLGTTLFIDLQSGGSGTLWSQSEGYNVWPATMTTGGTAANWDVAIVCFYTESAAAPTLPRRRRLLLEANS